jgi:hypothetical protein
MCSAPRTPTPTSSTQINPNPRWDAAGTPSTNKVLQELVRKAALKCQFDDIQTSKLLNTANPITDRYTYLSLL